jgi:hypothetical protein
MPHLMKEEVDNGRIDDKPGSKPARDDAQARAPGGTNADSGVSHKPASNVQTVQCKQGGYAGVLGVPYS